MNEFPIKAVLVEADGSERPVTLKFRLDDGTPADPVLLSAKAIEELRATSAVIGTLSGSARREPECP